MDTAKAASLQITGSDGRVVLAVDRTRVTAGGKTYDVPPLTSWLMEKDAGIVAECRDELPAAAVERFQHAQ